MCAIISWIFISKVIWIEMPKVMSIIIIIIDTKYSIKRIFSIIQYLPSLLLLRISSIIFCCFNLFLEHFSGSLDIKCRSVFHFSWIREYSLLGLVKWYKNFLISSKNALYHSYPLQYPPYSIIYFPLCFTTHTYFKSTFYSFFLFSDLDE